MVIDDSKSMRKIIIKTLATAFENLDPETVLEGTNGMDGWNRLEQAKGEGNLPDLILCDWNMPELDGLEFLTKVKGSSDYKSIPVIMVTTESEKSKVIEAIKAGVNNYVSKPFTPEGLKEKVVQTFKAIGKM